MTDALFSAAADLLRELRHLTPGFAVPSPLGEGRYQLRPAVNLKVKTQNFGRTLSQLRI